MRMSALGTISTSLGTIDGHVDGIETLLGTTNTNTGATTTAITDISKAEDAVHTSGDKGIMALAVRKDTAAAQTSADGDYSSLLTDGNGRLYTAAALYLGATAVTAGDGAVASGTPRVTLASDDPAVAALVAIRDATTTINVAPDTAAIKNGATSLTPKFAAISSTDDGDTVAPVSGKKIRVVAMFFVVAGATTVKFQSGATTDKTGAMSFAANGGISLPYNPNGWFETAAGEKLNHVLGSAVAIAGGVSSTTALAESTETAQFHAKHQAAAE